MAVQHWEYKVLHINQTTHVVQYLLNEQGAEGWEVCGYAAQENWTEVCLKRPVPVKVVG